MKRLAITLFILSGIICAQAQDTTTNTPAGTGLRADGKIYVVALVAVVILLGLFIYVISLDRKISRLERMESKTKK